jgi:hypothetical protein
LLSILFSIKLCRNGSYHRHSVDGSAKDLAASRDEPANPPLENCKPVFNVVNDVRGATTTTASKNGSNGRANSVHLIGPAPPTETRCRSYDFGFYSYGFFTFDGVVLIYFIWYLLMLHKTIDQNRLLEI